MNWIQRLVTAVGARREPSPREVLDAHLRVLLARFVRGAEAPTAGEANPAVLESARDDLEDERTRTNEAEGIQGAITPDAAAGYYLQVEAGLTHLRVVAERAGWVSLELPLDAFLLQRWTERELAERVAALGFAQGNHAFQYTLQQPVASTKARRQFVRRIERVLHELLEQPPEALYSVTIERDRQLDNAPLLDSFRELARRRDMESRRLVYQGLINSRLLLPLDERSEGALFPAVETRRAEQAGHESWVAFTDLDALRDYRNPPDPFVSVAGIRLVQAMRIRQISGLLLNPKSRVGGELLPNEIDMLADYLQSLGLLRSEGADR